MESVRGDLGDIQGRYILRITEADGTDEGGLSISVDRRQNQRELFEGALDRAGSDARERAFALGVVALWETYDHEELVMCLIQLGNLHQAVAVQKPWVTESHPHDARGVRLPEEGLTTQ